MPKTRAALKRTRSNSREEPYQTRKRLSEQIRAALNNKSSRTSCGLDHWHNLQIYTGSTSSHPRAARYKQEFARPAGQIVDCESALLQEILSLLPPVPTDHNLLLPSNWHRWAAKLRKKDWRSITSFETLYTPDPEQDRPETGLGQRLQAPGHSLFSKGFQRARPRALYAENPKKRAELERKIAAALCLTDLPTTIALLLQQKGSFTCLHWDHHDQSEYQM